MTCLLSLYSYIVFSKRLHHFPYMITSFSLHENIVFPMRKYCFPYEKTMFSNRENEKGCSLTIIFDYLESYSR